MPRKAWCAGARKREVSAAKTGSACRLTARRPNAVKSDGCLKMKGWISDLDVDENIMLSQQLPYLAERAGHPGRSAEVWRAFRFAWPAARPARGMRRWDLRKAACIRTFLGQPALHHSRAAVHGVYADLMAPLVNATRSARKRGGAAVLWMVIVDPKSGTIQAFAQPSGRGCSAPN
jgi:hypothetical protein